MFCKFSVIFTLLSFTLTSHLSASAAGVLPLFERNGEAYTCLGEEARGWARHRFNAWSDFGGRRDPNESLDQTALRELREESAGSFPHLTLGDINASRYYDHHRVNHHRQPHIYRQYFVDMRGKEGAQGPITAERMWNNARRVRSQPGPHHVEKTDYAFVKVSDLLQAVISHCPLQALLPADKNRRGLNDLHVTKPLHLSRPFRYLLSQPQSQQILSDFVTSVTRRPPVLRQDVVVMYSLPLPKNQELFNRFVNQAIPGKIMPDWYHVTLAWVPNVKSTHAPLLQNHLQTIANQFLGSATFTVDSAKRYLVGNRGPNSCGLVLSPRAQEIVQFKSINQRLQTEIQNFNQQHNENYQSLPDCSPGVFEPHITLARSRYINHLGLDRDRLLATVNQKINTGTFEALHLTPPSPVPLPQVTPVAVVPSPPVALQPVLPVATVRAKPVVVSQVVKRAPTLVNKVSPSPIKGPIRTNIPSVRAAVVNRTAIVKREVAPRQPVHVRTPLTRVNIVKSSPARLAPARLPAPQIKPVLRQANITRSTSVPTTRSVPARVTRPMPVRITRQTPVTTTRQTPIRNLTAPITKNRVPVVARRQQPPAAPQKVVTRTRRVPMVHPRNRK
jgi:2'-5' RNA ligase/ADP-ribose pyrophosphatase YjhB (NUDIX family)